MGIQKKFALLAGVAGVILALIAVTGYYLSYRMLSDSVQSELSAGMETRSTALDGWLEGKEQLAVAAANLMAKTDDGTKSPEELRALLSMSGEDTSQVSDLIVGNANGQIVGYHAGDLSAKLHPTEMRFYNEPKEAGGVVYMDTYVDKVTGKLVVTIAAPYYRADGSYGGAIDEDIFLDILQDEVKQLKYRGQGAGIIVDRAGVVMAAEDESLVGKNVTDVPGLAEHWDAMSTDGSGYFSLQQGGASQVFAYATVPRTKWIVGVMVPEQVVFGAMTSLKIAFSVLTIVGILLIVLACLRFSSDIVRRILALKEHAAALAEGNLTVDDIQFRQMDEITELSAGFNAMKNHIRKLIRQMTDTSSQVAASSEELTASAQQSAEASTSVAQNVAVVSESMETQAKHVDTATKSAQQVAENIKEVARRTDHVRSLTDATAQSSQHGQDMMPQAVARMERIEQSVDQSTEVVAKLGENSKQIGDIVDTIASIAEQTNLLALNAAIEAARAGEQGRGFSVVADEVRKLAEQSQEAAEEIRMRITSVQADTEAAVSAMQGGTQDVKEGVAAIRSVGEEFAHIMEQVADIRARMTEIDASVRSVSDGGEQIAQIVKEIDGVSRTTSDQTSSISAATEEQSASNEEIAAASQSLAKLAQDLQDMAARFHI